MTIRGLQSLPKIGAQPCRHLRRHLDAGEAAAGHDDGVAQLRYRPPDEMAQMPIELDRIGVVVDAEPCSARPGILRTE